MQLNFSLEARPEDGRVQAVVRGQRFGESWVQTIRTALGTGEELHRTITAIAKRDADGELKGFCRAIQKILEASR